MSWRDWFRTIAGTRDANGKPRSPALAAKLADALHNHDKKAVTQLGKTLEKISADLADQTAAASDSLTHHKEDRGAADAARHSRVD